jgi:hypothetical protein
MTFGLAILGLVVQFPVLFFLVYGMITLSSVIWLIINFSIVIKQSQRKRSDQRLVEEIDAQGWWFIINVAVLLVFAFYLPTPTINEPEGLAMELSSRQFVVMSIVAYVGSLIDFWLNRREYFPRLRT